MVHHNAFTLLQFIIGWRRTDVDSARRERFELLEGQRTVVYGGREAETVIHQVLLAGIVSAIHRADLRNRYVALVYYQKEILREIVQEAEGTLARFPSVEIAGIILDTRTMPQFADHFQIVSDAFVETLGLIRFDLPNGLIDAFLCGDEEVGWINIQFVLFIYILSRIGIERRNAVDFISPEFNSIRYAVKRLDGRENIHRVAIHPETTAREIHFVVDIKRRHKTTEQLVAVDVHALFQVDHLFGKSTWIGHTIKARNG